MASVWLTTRDRRRAANAATGSSTGSEAASHRPRYGGTFKRKADADERKRWINGELAARRVPDLRALGSRAAGADPDRRLRSAGSASRVDVSAATDAYQRSALPRLATGGSGEPPRRRDQRRRRRRRSSATLAAAGKARETIRKTVTVLAMVLDHAGVSRTRPATACACGCRARSGAEIQPPTAEHVHAVHRLLAARLPAAAARARRDRDARRRARAAHLGRRRRAARPLARLAGRREDAPRPLGAACRPCSSRPCTELVAARRPHPERRVFQGFGGDRFRTAIARACTAAGVPRSRRTTSGTGGSRCCTWAACRGRGSASTSASATSP